MADEDGGADTAASVSGTDDYDDVDVADNVEGSSPSAVQSI